jgi:CheY-like chemotaxis protein
LALVLIVDDTEIVRRAIERAIAKMGHSAVSTADGLEALELAATAPPDLALLDYRMPGMNGARLFQELRSSLGARCPKVLFVSATPPDEVARDVAHIGRAAGFVKKPFHLEDLCKAVERALM